ncbi:MAG: DMT family transporter [Gammaproteobacteria bacterium]
MKPLHILFAVAVAVFWGTGFVVAKAAFDQFPPIMLMALRFAVAALVMVWFVEPPWHLMGRIFVVALVSAAAQYSLTFTGLKGLDASTAIVIVQLEMPFMVLLAAIFFKDILGWRRLFGMILALAGVGLIAGQPQLQQDWLPLLLVASGAFVWAVGQIMAKMLAAAGGITLIAWVAVFATPQLFVCSWLFEQGQIEALVAADAVGWAQVLYLGVVMTVLAYAIWYHLLGRYDVNEVAPFLLLLPVVTVVASVVLLGEQPTWPVVVGGIAAITGVAVILTHRKPPAELPV